MGFFRRKKEGDVVAKDTTNASGSSSKEAAKEPRKKKGLLLRGRRNNSNKGKGATSNVDTRDEVGWRNSKYSPSTPEHGRRRQRRRGGRNGDNEEDEEEFEPRTANTAAMTHETPEAGMGRGVLNDVSLVGSQDFGDFELIYGDMEADTGLPKTPTHRSSSSSDDPDTVRKALFRDELEEEEERKPVDNIERVVGRLSEEEASKTKKKKKTPLDDAEGTADPSLTNGFVMGGGAMNNAERNDLLLEELQQQQQQAFQTEDILHDLHDNGVLLDEQDNIVQHKQRQQQSKGSVARQLFETFTVCDDVTDREKYSFYDCFCGPEDFDREKTRPFFNENFAFQFIRQSTADGLLLLQHVAPENLDDDQNWTGRSVTMFIRLGSWNVEKVVQPRLEWISMGGGQFPTPITETVDFVDITILSDSIGDEARDDVATTGEEDDEANCFFSITSRNGQVYLFEAGSHLERDRIVNGIKNVIARLAFHLIAGDDAVASELYNEDHGDLSGELPALKNSAAAMSGVTHAFLDIEEGLE